MRAVGERAGVDRQKVEAIIASHEEEYYYYIERFADVFLETRVMAKSFAVVSDAQYTLALTKFLANDLGLSPSKQYITADTPEEYQEQVAGYFKDLNYGVQAEVGFSSDGHQIQEEIRQTDFHGYPLILGSAWEKKIAEETKAHYLPMSWPLIERLVINGTYVGYDGGLKLLEDIYSIVLTRFN